jgi:uncharacterized membrane protein
MVQSLRVIIGVLSLAGLADALYFTLAYYGRVRRARWVPQILCAREGSSCVTVLQTPCARVFGVPNSLLGIVYYLAVMLWLPCPRDVHAVDGSACLFRFLTGALMLASAAAVILGGYLVYALRRQLHTHCALCYTAHGINLALFILLLVYCCAVL